MDENNRNLVHLLDETIRSISMEISEKKIRPEIYADTIKALAVLVEARVKMYKASVIFNYYPKHKFFI